MAPLRRGSKGHNMLKTRKSELTYLPFKKAAEAWLETRRPFLSPRTFEDYGKHIETLAHLLWRT
jgi:hypothetical protein